MNSSAAWKHGNGRGLMCLTVAGKWHFSTHTASMDALKFFHVILSFLSFRVSIFMSFSLRFLFAVLHCECIGHRCWFEIFSFGNLLFQVYSVKCKLLCCLLYNSL